MNDKYRKLKDALIEANNQGKLSQRIYGGILTHLFYDKYFDKLVILAYGAATNANYIKLYSFDDAWLYINIKPYEIEHLETYKLESLYQKIKSINNRSKIFDDELVLNHEQVNEILDSETKKVMVSFLKDFSDLINNYKEILNVK